MQYITEQFFSAVRLSPCPPKVPPSKQTHTHTESWLAAYGHTCAIVTPDACRFMVLLPSSVPNVENHTNTRIFFYPVHREKAIEGDIINGNCRKVGMSSVENASPHVFLFNINTHTHAFKCRDWCFVLHLQGDTNLQKDGSRHPSVSDAEENFAVLRRSVRGLIQIVKSIWFMECFFTLFQSSSLTSFISILMNHFMLLIWLCDICRHVMNELLETERAYVEELLCVLEVSCTYICPPPEGRLAFGFIITL